MKKTVLLSFLLMTASAISAENYLISTGKTSLLITAEKGGKPMYQYYGSRIGQTEIQGIFDAGLALNAETYPAFGVKTANEKAIAVQHNDGNMTLDLAITDVRQFSENDADITEITLKDKVYPFGVKQYFKAYKETDIISTWVEIENQGKKPVTLHRFASAFFPLHRFQKIGAHLLWQGQVSCCHRYVGQR